MAGSRYVPITLQQMDDLLVGECGFTRRLTPLGHEKEWVYERQVTFKEGSKRAPASGLILPMLVRVWSSVHMSDGISRDNGEDAIRVDLINLALQGEFAAQHPNGFPVNAKDHVGVTKKLYRTKNALDNLYKACRGMFDVAARISCPKCGAPLRRRKGSNGEFYGCSQFPTCNGTKPLEAVLPPEAVPAF